MTVDELIEELKRVSVDGWGDYAIMVRADSMVQYLPVSTSDLRIDVNRHAVLFK